MCFRHIGMGKVSRAVFGSPLFMMCGEGVKVAIDSQSFFQNISFYLVVKQDKTQEEKGNFVKKKDGDLERKLSLQAIRARCQLQMSYCDLGTLKYGGCRFGMLLGIFLNYSYNQDSRIQVKHAKKISTISRYMQSHKKAL